MTACDCGFAAKSPAGLAAHRRACTFEPVEPVESVLTQVRRDLAQHPRSGLKATACAIARAIDETTSPRELPALSKELRAVLAALGVDQAQDEPEVSGVDELTKRRNSRIAVSDV